MGPSRARRRGLPALGTLVSKMFGAALHYGQVTELCPADPFPVTVKYQDGQVENYSMSECRKQLRYNDFNDAVSRWGLTCRSPTVCSYGTGVTRTQLHCRNVQDAHPGWACDE